MDQRQLRGKQLEHGNGRRLVVHKDAPLACGQNLPAQNDFAAVRIDAVFFEDGLGPGCGLEDAGDNGLLRAVADHLRRCLAAHQQSQRIHKNRLARARLAGEQVQPWAKDGDGVIDDGVVLGAQLNEHFGEPLGAQSTTGTIVGERVPGGNPSAA